MSNDKHTPAERAAFVELVSGGSYTVRNGKLVKIEKTLTFTADGTPMVVTVERR